MRTAILRLKLRSATTFGRGDGVSGLVDREVEHDHHGFPFLRGRALKGLLAETAEDLAFAFEQQGVTKWMAIKNELFGNPGSSLDERGLLHVSDARIPENLRRLAVLEIEELRSGSGQPASDKILAALTGIRRQTAMNHFGAPERDTLRSMRVIVRGVVFESELSIDDLPEDDAEEPRLKDYWTLLAGLALGLRHAGTGRNRGRGWLRATLIDDATTLEYFRRLSERE
jgi:hypothetical protein